jgi:segregation and condensation protein B
VPEAETLEAATDQTTPIDTQPDGDDLAAASPTADEAENPLSDADDGDAEKDTEESRA